MSRRMRLLLAGLIGMALLLSGCTPSTEPIETEDLKGEGFWKHYIVYPISWSLDFFADLVFTNDYVIAILIVTIIIRLLILPLTLKSYRSTKEMQKLQPELKAVKEKYKDDPKKQQEETLRLFQTHGVNPMAGCMPLIVQMPILIALYNAIVWNPGIQNDSFLWLELGEKDPYFILPTIAALTTWIQQKMMSSTQQNNPMQALMIIFPIMIFVMSMSFDSALPLYWIFGNLFTIVQSYFIYVRPNAGVTIADGSAAIPAGAPKKKGKGKGKGGRSR